MRTATDNYYSRLTEMAASARLSVSGLCRKAGVAPATAARWKVGTASPSMRIWEKLEGAAKEAEGKLICPSCESNDTEHVMVDKDGREMRACCVCFKCYQPGLKA